MEKADRIGKRFKVSRQKRNERPLGLKWQAISMVLPKAGKVTT